MADMKSSISQTFLHIPPTYPYFFTMSTFCDKSRSEIDESELSDPLNTTAFNTETHATAGDVADQAMHGDFVEIGGKTYISAEIYSKQFPIQAVKIPIIDLFHWL